MTENSNANITKASISNYSSTLTQNSNPLNSGRDDRVIYRLMYSPNLYDFDSEQYHSVMLQEKSNGSYVL